MSLNIKNERVVDLVRELADLTGETMTSAIEHAVREQLARLRSDGHEPSRVAERRARVERSLRRLQTLARGSDMTRERIDADMWDEQGLPR